jgi:hypothetical protein
VQFFNKIGLAPKPTEAMPFSLRSPNAITSAHTLIAFVISVVAGAKRLAHADWLRFDTPHAMFGIGRFPGSDTVRNLFARFTQSTIEASWRPLWRWLLPLIDAPAEGVSLDLDSTVFQRSSPQQGTAKGYNSKRPGRKTHHPLLAALGEAQCVLHAWLRSGKTSASRGVSHFFLRGADSCSCPLEDPLRAGQLRFLCTGTFRVSRATSDCPRVVGPVDLLPPTPRCRHPRLDNGG